jgi:glycosyltransferase involved in cell wall biosynthesis
VGLNLLLLDQFSDLGGAQLALLDLLPAIQARSWRPVIAAPGAGPLFSRARAAGAIAERISCGPYSSGGKTASDIFRFSRDFPALVRQIRELSERHRIDLLYINGPRLVAAAIGAVGRHLPVLFHCHSYIPQPYAGLLVGAPLRWAGATVICASRFTAEPISRYIHPKNLHIVYNGVAGCKRAGIASAAGHRIGMVGRISRQKGQALFVRAARILIDRLPGCRFIICGSALFSDPAAIQYQQEVRGLAAGLPVEFIDWTDDICSVLARVDVLVVPSTVAEATTRVILEAFSGGVAIIAFATGGIPEVVQHGRNGFLVKEHSAEALAASLFDVLSRSSLNGIRNAAREDWEARFTLARYQREVLQIAEEACGTKRRTVSRQQR